MTTRKSKPVNKLSESLFNWALVSLAAYRNQGAEYNDALEDAALEFEAELAENNRWLKGLIKAGKR